MTNVSVVNIQVKQKTARRRRKTAAELAAEIVSLWHARRHALTFDDLIAGWPGDFFPNNSAIRNRRPGTRLARIRDRDKGVHWGRISERGVKAVDLVWENLADWIDRPEYFDTPPYQLFPHIVAERR